MYYKKTKKPKIDICHICLQTKELSWDHVPPKGCFELTPVRIENLFYKLTGHPNNKKSVISQNGVKHRTICSDCNSQLGSKYDRRIIEFTNSIVNYLNNSRIISEEFYIKCQPTAIAKGILAHLLSTKISIDPATTLDEKIREIVFDDSKNIPDDIYIYYWLYPYDITIIWQDFVIVDLGNIESAVFSQLLKFFPIAFWVSNKKINLPTELTKYRVCSIYEVHNIPLKKNYIQPISWPEHPENDKVIILGEEGTNSIIAQKRKL